MIFLERYGGTMVRKKKDLKIVIILNYCSSGAQINDVRIRQNFEGPARLYKS